MQKHLEFLKWYSDMMMRCATTNDFSKLEELEKKEPTMKDYMKKGPELENAMIA